MRRKPHVGILLATTLAVVLGGLVASPAEAKPRTHPATRYNPPAGIKVNDPLAGIAKRREILSHILRSISATPKGSRIRIASWNLRSNDVANELVWAHRRGVSVRFIIDAGNANKNNPNAAFDWLKRELRKGNKKRIKGMRSWARRCNGSCRGSSGISHTKMFLFSKVGKKTRYVSMFGSANATDLAAGYQWNDNFTLKNNKEMYDRFVQIFNEMGRDRPVRQGYLEFGTPQRTALVFPYVGQGANGDPVLGELAKVQCKGATGKWVTNGRTVVRIAMTAMSDARGIAIAKRLRQMWDRGCNLRIVYAVMGNRVLGVLRNPAGRGAVPIRQIAQDWNLDGLYDRYLHMKVLTVAGVYGNRTDATVTWNGSANWTSMALKSDEVGMRIHSPKVRVRYARWFDHLFNNPPPRPELSVSTQNLEQPALARLVNGTYFRTEAPVVADPYANVEID